MLGLDDIVPYRPADNVGKGFKLQLPHDCGAVGLDRLDAERQTARDLLVAIALPKELYDFSFTRREPITGQARPAGAATFQEALKNYLGDPTREKRLVARKTLHRGTSWRVASDLRT